MSSFQERLKEEMAYKGLLIKELAEKTGINKRTLDSYLDARKVMPPADVAVKIANALDISVEFLVTGKESKIKSVSLEDKKILDLIHELDNRDKTTVLYLLDNLCARCVNSSADQRIKRLG